MLSFAYSSTLSTTLKAITRTVAISAASALNLFMDDGVGTPRLQIEDVAGEVLELLPHTSPDM